MRDRYLPYISLDWSGACQTVVSDTLYRQRTYSEGRICLGIQSRQLF